MAVFKFMRVGEMFGILEFQNKRFNITNNNRINNLLVNICYPPLVQVAQTKSQVHLARKGLANETAILWYV